MKLLDEHTAQLNVLCKNFEKYTDQSDLEHYVTIEDCKWIQRKQIF